MAWWIWILFGLGLLVLEMLTPGGLFALFFGFSALAVAVMSALGLGPAWLQWLVFAALGVALLLLLRSRIQARLRTRRIPVDSLVGEVAIPLADLPAEGTGKAELRGTTWEARNAAGRPIARGARCHVEKVDGLTLWIRPE
ncbi:MAG TPA: NfeD family protein [Anaeromyxobacteraceae bacterium]|nr:NfeD family protein [Anaeromyxobacteraceae bacterium]